MGVRVLEAEGITAIRGERCVFRGLSFRVPAGGALIVSGPNGAGKSTLLRLLAGLLPPAAGRLTFDGEDIADDPVLHARRLAYLGDQNALKPGFTAAENLRFAARLTGGDATQALAALGIAALADVPVRFFSTGQKRRLALARIALSAVPLWLLDEPSNGLDVAAVDLLGRLFTTERARGGIVVVASHLPLPLPDAISLALA